MSTRATYRFLTDGARDSSYSGAITLYIHSDGYHAGAAEYFARAVASQLGSESRGGIVEAFIRANAGAELTPNHEAHYDTEYRYTLSVGTNETNLLVQQRMHGWGEDEKPTWRTSFGGSLVEFLNEQHAAAIKDACGWTKELNASDGYKTYPNRGIVSVAWLTSQALNLMETARKHLANGCMGNASSLAANAARYVGAGGMVPLAELVAFLREVCATFPHMVAYHLREAGLPEELAEDGAAA